MMNKSVIEKNYNTIDCVDKTADLNPLPQKKVIDEFFDEVGYGRYQFFSLFVFILVFFADGTEILVISIIMKSLEDEWKITPFQKSLLASSAFLGLIIGSFVTAKYIDIYGRKIFLQIGGVVVIIFGFLCCMSNDAYQLFILRVVTGIGIGAQVPAATNLAAESIPSYNRSIYLANLWIAFPLGELYVCIIGLQIMPNFEKDQWRLLLLYCLAPVVLCVICSFFIMESGRFLLTNGRFDDAKKYFRSLSEISKTPLSEEKLNAIVKESIDSPLNKYESTFSMLLDKRFLKLSLYSWVVWFVGSFVLYGTIYMLPQILAAHPEYDATKGGQMFKDVIVSNIISLPKSLIAGFVSNIPCLGRKFSMFHAFILMAIVEMVIIIDTSHVHVYSGIIKLAGGTILGIIKVYATEAYPTKIRGMGYGTGHSICRIAGCIVPFCCELFRGFFDLLGPCYFFLLLSLFASFCCYMLPFETLGRELDKVEGDDDQEEKEKLKGSIEVDIKVKKHNLNKSAMF